jgi:aminoglycoside 6'-N-acetyltransferase
VPTRTRLRQHRYVVTLRPMVDSDLALIETWLGQPHVARRWPPNVVARVETDKYRARIAGQQPVTMLMVVDGGKPIGWCQWYRWDDHVADAAASGAEPHEIGIDYEIGDKNAVRRGVGTEMIRTLVEAVRKVVGPVGFLVAPEASNLASRRVLEKNGFELVGIRPIATEWTDAPMAIHRRSSQRV